jgi:inner membrane protein
MDPLTHALSGLTVSFCLPEQTKRQHIFCLIAASLPDIDNLFFILGKESYLMYHRGFCHSFFGGLLLAIILTSLFHLFRNNMKWTSRLYLAYALVCLHLFLDLITSYGTQLFAPFTSYRCAIPCVFIIDFILTGFLLICVMMSILAQKHRKTIARIGLCFILIYPFFCKMVQFIQLERSKTVLNQNSRAIHVLPGMLAPVYWKVIIENESCYELRHLSIFSTIQQYPPYTFEKANFNALISQFPNHSLIKTYDWFVDYPAQIKGADCLKVFDLKFISANPRLNRFQNRKHIPFMLCIYPDNQLKLK